MNQGNMYLEIGEIISLCYIAGEQYPYLSWYRIAQGTLSSRTAITRIIDTQLFKRVSSELATGDEVELSFTTQDHVIILKDFKMHKQLPGRMLKVTYWPLFVDDFEEARNIFGTLRRNMLGINWGRKEDRDVKDGKSIDH